MPGGWALGLAMTSGPPFRRSPSLPPLAPKLSPQVSSARGRAPASPAPWAPPPLQLQPLAQSVPLSLVGTPRDPLLLPPPMSPTPLASVFGICLQAGANPFAPTAGQLHPPLMHGFLPPMPLFSGGPANQAPPNDDYAVHPPTLLGSELAACIGL